ncbi:CopG family ribbon-helix-helix protein [Komagataeibacter europaeus]|uniref:CopG family ribbon-helix-helix protein n=1 Tax=Komagataeibacter europaeus TaxID=33995 RepID=UPI0002D9BD3F|nr:ribbon-helix-helix protein, CopG family [Komagataeibacter europaeus]GBQ45090.1 hypothetical protein AA18890_2362 [Komagataeibacter europaeus LMG 18890]
MSEKITPTKQTVSVQMPTDLVEEMDRYGEGIERPRSWVMREAVADYLRREKAKDDATRVALKQADEGLFISGDAVKAWANSIGTDNPLPLPKPGQ